MLQIKLWLHEPVLCSVREQAVVFHSVNECTLTGLVCTPRSGSAVTELVSPCASLPHAHQWPEEPELCRVTHHSFHSANQLWVRKVCPTDIQISPKILWKSEIVWPRGKTGKLPLWRMVDLHKGHKGKHSSFHTALFLLRERITVQLPLEKYTILWGAVMFSHQDAKQGVSPPIPQAHPTPWPSSVVPTAWLGLEPCCAHHQSNLTDQDTFPLKISWSMKFKITVLLL